MVFMYHILWSIMGLGLTSPQYFVTPAWGPRQNNPWKSMGGGGEGKDMGLFPLASLHACAVGAISLMQYRILPRMFSVTPAICRELTSDYLAFLQLSICASCGISSIKCITWPLQAGLLTLGEVQRGSYSYPFFQLYLQYVALWVLLPASCRSYTFARTLNCQPTTRVNPIQWVWLARKHA